MTTPLNDWWRGLSEDERRRAMQVLVGIAAGLAFVAGIGIGVQLYAVTAL